MSSQPSSPGPDTPTRTRTSSPIPRNASSSPFSSIPRVSSNGTTLSSMANPIVVLKIGSSSLAAADGQHPNLSAMCALVECICKLRRRGYRVVLVSSGAVAFGCQRMRLAAKPADLCTKQAVAAIGQGRLMKMYDDFFSALDQPVAQVLLTRENLSVEHHYRNAQNTFIRLLEMGVVPIVNENDTVSVAELRFGDNDTLSALVASLIDADWLFLLTDVDALYTSDPRLVPDAKPIRVVEKIDELAVELGTAGAWGTGGMATKIQAARIATAAGTRTVICRSTDLDAVEVLLSGGSDRGTQFVPVPNKLKGRKRFLAHGQRATGSIHLDAGAARAIKQHASLFAAGISRVDGEFDAQTAVSVCDASTGAELARALPNYSSKEIRMLMGHSSREFAGLLGYAGPDEIASRWNIAVV